MAHILLILWPRFTPSHRSAFMSQVSFDNFAKAATQTDLVDTEIAGRYPFQALAERRILSDLIQKLNLQPADRLLEVGCGPGNLLIPLSFFVSSATGIDNLPAIERMRNRAPGATNLTGLAGNFLELDVGEARFDKILVYSVLHYLATEEEVFAFVDRCLACCAPGGQILLGDLPNRDRKQRFGASEAGQAVRADWDNQITQAGSHAFDTLPGDQNLVAINDNLILAIMAHVRQRGYEAYLLPQPLELPFGGSREDILITAHR